MTTTWTRTTASVALARGVGYTGRMTLAEFILAACLKLAPGRDHAALAEAITDRVEAEAPIFRADTDKRKTAAELVAVAFRESSLRADAVGDKGTSFCAFQIHKTSGGSPALTEDVHACVAAAFAMLRTSARVCPAHPVAWYAEGPGGCDSSRAQRISRDRMALAAWLVRTVR
jgi:hypothetical protein